MSIEPFATLLQGGQPNSLGGTDEVARTEQQVRRLRAAGGAS